MVTLPSEAASDRDSFARSSTAGMDGADQRGARRRGRLDRDGRARSCGPAQPARRVPILVDLPGPKLRTGSIEPGPEVVHLRPRHDALGAVVAPARAWLAA